MIRVVEATKCLRDDILRYCEKLPQTSWPPMIDQLSTTEAELPELVTLFMTELLKIERHNPSRIENNVIREKSSKSNGSTLR